MIHFSDWASRLRQQTAALSVLIAVLVFVSAASALDLDFNVASGNYNVASNWIDPTNLFRFRRPRLQRLPTGPLFGTTAR